MRKINNISDLRAAQKALKHQQHQLEKELLRDWNDAKQYLTPGNDSFFSFLKKQYTANIAAQGISFAAGVVARKFGGKIGERVYSWFKRQVV
jgi:hypothetical protein